MVHVILAKGNIFKEKGVTTAQLEEIHFKQDQLIKFVKNNVRDSGYPYRLHFCKHHIDDSVFEDIKKTDIVLWHPNLAATNIDFVTSYNKSIVILMTKTIYIRKLSLINPINENMAVNHGFHVMYIDEKYSDNTNNEWKLVVDKESYLITKERFDQLLKEMKNG